MLVPSELDKDQYGGLNFKSASDIPSKRIQWYWSGMIAEGKSVTIGVYDTAESAAAAQPKVGELLGRLADLVNAPPEVQEGPVFWEL